MVSTIEAKKANKIELVRLPEQGVTIRANVPLRLRNAITEQFEDSISYGEICIRDVYGFVIRRALALPIEQFDKIADMPDTYPQSTKALGTHFFMPTDISVGLDAIRNRKDILKKDAFVLALKVGLLATVLPTNKDN